jgi:hypothetical protein
MKPSAAVLATDAHWFIDNFDPQSRKLAFLQMDRARLSDAPFLDQRLDRTGCAQALVGVDEVASGSHVVAPPEINFIWHTAFCCSTLIAHTLDAPGKNLALREPGVTMTLASAKRGGLLAPERGGEKLARATFQLLARRFDAAEKILVKPTNAVNTLVEEAARLTHGKMLFLYSDCRSFVTSIAKKNLDGRIFVRKLFSVFAADGDPLGRLPGSKLFEMSDLQVAALVWQIQIRLFRSAMALLGDRAVSLNCDVFLSDPGGTLAKLDRFFGLGLGAEHIADVVNGPLLSRNAKNPEESYSSVARRNEEQAMAQSLGADLDRIIDWSYQAAPETPRGVPLPRALNEVFS